MIKLIEVWSVIPKELTTNGDVVGQETKSIFLNPDRIVAVQSPDKHQVEKYSRWGYTVTEEDNTLIYLDSIQTTPVVTEEHIYDFLGRINSL